MRPRLKTLLALTAAAVSAPLHGESLTAISRSIQTGDYRNALEQLEAMPAADGARERFLRGTALAAAGRTEEAITIFKALIADYPRFPEPYNNLAALYASENRLEEAKEVLERAIRTRESYATVYENLSAIYIEMARNSYVKALRLEDGNRPPSLNMLFALDSVPAADAVTSVATAAEAAAEPDAEEEAVADGDATGETASIAPTVSPSEHAAASVESGRVELPVPAPAVEESVADAENPPVDEPASDEMLAAIVPSDETPAEVAPESGTVDTMADAAAESVDATAVGESESETETVVAAVSENRGPAGPEEAGQSQAAEPVVADSAKPADRIRTVLNAWAAAWANQRVDEYLGYYAPEFEPSGTQSRKAWESERRRRIGRPGRITVELTDMDVRLSGDEAVVRLMQHYRSDVYRDKTLKRFELVHRDGDWVIRSEKSLKIIR